MPKSADIAYHQIRNMILEGELKPGDQLKEEELADACSVSRTPVRDA